MTVNTFRNWLCIGYALVSAFSALTARGFTYQNRDLLLVFRKDGFNDVEYNLGPVDRLLTLTNGQQLTLTNWDSSLAFSAYGNLTNGVQVALLASTAVNAADRAVWISSSDSSTAPLDRTESQWQQLWSKADAVGEKPAEYTGTNAVSSIVVAPALYPSFTYIASNGGSAPTLTSKLGGASTFSIVATAPAVLKFYGIRPSTANPKPASSLIGSFAITAQGEINFTEGSPPTTPLDSTRITGIVPATNAITINFNTVAGAKYRLRYTDLLNAPLAAWSIGNDTVRGAGAPASLQDLVPPIKTRFYAVESFQ